MEDTLYQVWPPCTTGRTIRDFLDSLVLPPTYRELARKWNELGRPHLYSLHSRLAYDARQTTIMQCCNLDDLVALQDLMCLEIVSQQLKRRQEEEEDSPESERAFEETASYIHLYTLLKVELDAKQYHWNDEVQRDRFEAYWRQALLFLDMNRSTCHLAPPHPCLHTALWGDCVHLPTGELFRKFEKWLSTQATPSSSSQTFAQNAASTVSSSPSLAEIETSAYREQRRLAISVDCSPSFSHDTRDSSSSVRSFIDDTDWMAGLEGFNENCGIFDIGIHEEQDALYSILDPSLEPSSSRSPHVAAEERAASSPPPAKLQGSSSDAETGSPSEQDRIEQNRRKSKRYYTKRKLQRDLLGGVSEQFASIVLLSEGAGESSLRCPDQKNTRRVATQQPRKPGARRTANERKWQSKCSLREAEKKQIQRISSIARLTNTLNANKSSSLQVNLPDSSIVQSIASTKEPLCALLEQWSSLQPRWDELVSAEITLLSLVDGPVSHLVHSLRTTDTQGHVHKA